MSRLDLESAVKKLKNGTVLELTVEEKTQLIKQAERVEKLEKENSKLINLSLGEHFEKMRYKQALEEIVNAPDDMSRGRHSNFSEHVASQALEGEG